MALVLVEAVCWDISLGLAGTRLGQLLLRTTSTREETVPAHVDHAGIKVFENVYEYGDCGILRSQVSKGIMPPSRYPTFCLREVEAIGETTKTQAEFEAWISELNKTDFSGSRYDFVKHNCIVWAKRATDFLDVSYPRNWDNILSYGHGNPRLPRGCLVGVAEGAVQVISNYMEPRRI